MRGIPKTKESHQDSSLVRLETPGLPCPHRESRTGKRQSFLSISLKGKKAQNSLYKSESSQALVTEELINTAINNKRGNFIGSCD